MLSVLGFNTVVLNLVMLSDIFIEKVFFFLGGGDIRLESPAGEKHSSLFGCEENEGL
jgi:hypothetical protein